MPRSNDPGSLTVGTGLAAKDSVEANALVHPTGGNDGLQAHIVDPSRAHMAATTGLVDSAGNFFSDEVEGGMAELAGSSGIGTTNGLLTGGTWTRVGNVLTLDAGTTVRLGSSMVDMGGETIALPDGVRWVYVNPATGALASSVGPPGLDGEPVLIGLITTAAGVIDVNASLDARFFVTGIDRKPTLTLRTTGTATNANSEGNFATFEAALLYLEHYSGGADAETKTLTIRGTVTISATAVIPTDNVIFQGEGDATIITGAGVSPMLDLNGKNGVQFKDLTFACAHAASVAMGHAAAAVNGLSVERCKFLSSGQDWVTAINLANAGATNSAVLRDTTITASSTAVFIDRPSDVLIHNCTANEAGGAGVIGIDLGNSGPFAGEGDVHVVNSRVVGFGLGVQMISERGQVHGCSILDADDCLGSSGGVITVSDSTLQVDATNGVRGIQASSPLIVSNCVIDCPRVAWGAEIPVGINLQTGTSESTISNSKIGGFDNAGNGQGIAVSPQIDDITITGNQIGKCADGVLVSDGCSGVTITGNFLNGNSSGVHTQGQDAPNARTRNVTITGNEIVFFVNFGIQVQGYLFASTIDGNLVDGFVATDVYNPTGMGIQILANIAHLPSYITVSNNEVLRCSSGIILGGNSVANSVREVNILGNSVHHCGYAQDLTGVPPDNFIGRGGKGIGMEFCDGVQVIGNTVEKIGVGIDGGGVEGFPDTGAPVNDSQSRGIYARNCTRLTIDDNTVHEMLFTAGSNAAGYGIYVENHSQGSGGDFDCDNLSICNNRVTWVAGSGGLYGITVEASRGTDAGQFNTVTHAHIDGNLIRKTLSDAIRLQADGAGYFQDVSVRANDIKLVCQGAAPGVGLQAGIYMHADNSIPAGVQFKRFEITDNRIIDTGVSAATAGYGIALFLVQYGDVEDFVVSDNHMESIQDGGIEFNSGAWADVVALSGMVVAGNRIAAIGGDGIHFIAQGLASGPDSWTDVLVNGNSIRTSSAGNGISLVNAGPVTLFTVSGNSIQDVNTVGINVDSSSGDSSNINISGNNIVDTGSASIFVDITDDLRSCTIADNTLSLFAAIAGIRMLVAVDAEAINIHGNDLLSGANNVTGISALFGTGGLNNLIVSDNNVRLSGTGTTSMTFASGVGGTQYVNSFVGNALYGAATGVTAGANWAPDRSVVSTNVERTAGPGAGNWGPGTGTEFANVFTNSVTANNQD